MSKEVYYRCDCCRKVMNPDSRDLCHVCVVVENYRGHLGYMREEMHLCALCATAIPRTVQKLKKGEST